MANQSSKKEDAKKQDNEKTGGLAGAGAGALAGAQIGTAVMPVVGTFAGALVGGVLGSKVGKKVGGALLDKLDGKAAETIDKKDVTAELERLAKMREQNVLSDEEFKAAKAALLNL